MLTKRTANLPTQRAPSKDFADLKGTAQILDPFWRSLIWSLWSGRTLRCEFKLHLSCNSWSPFFIIMIVSKLAISDNREFMNIFPLPFVTRMVFGHRIRELVTGDLVASSLFLGGLFFLVCLMLLCALNMTSNALFVLLLAEKAVYI